MISKNYLIFEDVNSNDYNVYISGSGTYDAPERNIEFVTVPGRNGSLTIDNGAFKNIIVKYPAFIPSEFDKNMANFRARMRRLTGYHRLEDTYDLDHYRMGVLVDNFNPKTTTLNRAADFQISFNCKPQRYLKSGEKVITFDTTGTIQNPTWYEATPLIRVYGTEGSFSIGAQTVTILPPETGESRDYIDIDCELQDAYRGLNNMNKKIVLNNGFPVLPAGNSGIRINGLTRLEITPRWWTI